MAEKILITEEVIEEAQLKALQMVGQSIFDQVRMSPEMYALIAKLSNTQKAVIGSVVFQKLGLDLADQIQAKDVVNGVKQVATSLNKAQNFSIKCAPR